MFIQRYKTACLLPGRDEEFSTLLCERQSHEAVRRPFVALDAENMDVAIGVSRQQQGLLTFVKT